MKKMGNNTHLQSRDVAGLISKGLCGSPLPVLSFAEILTSEMPAGVRSPAEHVSTFTWYRGHLNLRKQRHVRMWHQDLALPSEWA